MTSGGSVEADPNEEIAALKTMGAAVVAALDVLHTIPGSSYTYPDSVARTIAFAVVSAAAPLVRAEEAERIAGRIEQQITGLPHHAHYDSAYAHASALARCGVGDSKEAGQ